MLFSTNTKAMMLTDDFQGLQIVNKRDLMVVQQYDYICQHDRNAKGMPYGSTKSSVLNVTIRIESAKLLRFFYSEIQNKKTHYYSFIFETDFNQSGDLESFEHATIAEGYITDIQEQFHTDKEYKDKQMTATIKILLSSIKYVNSSSYVSERISR